MRKVMSVSDVYKVFIGAWAIFRRFVGRVLSDDEWQQVIDEASRLNETYDSEFCKALLLAMLGELDAGDKYLRQVGK